MVVVLIKLTIEESSTILSKTRGFDFIWLTITENCVMPYNKEINSKGRTIKYKKLTLNLALEFSNFIILCAYKNKKMNGIIKRKSEGLMNNRIPKDRPEIKPSFLEFSFVDFIKV